MGSYQIYFGKQLLPVAPETLEIKINNQNSTLTLVDGSEINLLKAPGLSEITFDARLPIQKYAWSNYGGATDQVRFLSMFEQFKANKSVFEFTVLRNRSDYEEHKSAIFSTNMKVTLEDYTITEQQEYGGDVVVELNLKQFRPYYMTLAYSQSKKVVATGNSEADMALKVKTLTGDTISTLVARYYTAEAAAGNKAARAVINANTNTFSRYGVRVSGVSIMGVNSPLPAGVDITLPIV